MDSNKEKLKIRKNDPCPCGSDQKFKKCCFLNKLPSKGILRLAYERGINDPFMARMLFQITQIRDCVYRGDERKKFDKKYEPIFQNLFEARMAKEHCERLIETHTKKIKNKEICEYKSEDPVIRINETIDNDLNLFFKDFFIRGTIALRGLVKFAGFLGYNLSFAVISNEKKHLKKKRKFLGENQDEKFKDLCQMIDDDRKSWYLTFSEIRDAIEHDGFKVPSINYVLDKDNEVKPMYPTIDYQRIEELFDICWRNLFRFCEDIIIFLLSMKLRDPFTIIVIPEDKRDPASPIKYKVTVRDFPIDKINL